MKHGYRDYSSKIWKQPDNAKLQIFIANIHLVKS